MNKNNRISNRKSIEYYFEKSCRKKLYSFSSSESHMFAEDFASQIVPFLDLKKNLDIRLVGNGTEIAVNAFDENRYYGDLANKVRAFINDIAVSVMLYGDVYYEIVFQKEKEEEEQFCSFSFEKICFEKAYERINDVIFEIPSDIANKLKINKRIKIQNNRVLKFSFPKDLGGNKSIKKIFLNLSRLSKREILMTALKNNTFGFDQTKYYYEHDKLIAQSTGLLKWNGRGLISNRITEYYYLHRHIQFKKAQKVFMDYIIQEINIGLKEAGKEMNFACVLEIKGIPSIVDLELMTKRLNEGNLSFDEVVKI